MPLSASVKLLKSLQAVRQLHHDPVPAADAAAHQIGGDGRDPRVELPVAHPAPLEDEQLPVRGARRLVPDQIPDPPVVPQAQFPVPSGPVGR